MASTPSKLSSSKATARSVSHARLVAAKSASKPHKVTAAPKRSASNPPPPPASNVSKAKQRPSVPPSAGTGSEATRSGVSKNELKAQFAKLSTATTRIAGLKRGLNKSFYDIGVLLNQIRNDRLYEVKGYGSFESFVEREIDINKAICLKLSRIAEALCQDQAIAAGLERAAAAVAALDGETEPSPLLRPAGSPAGGVPLHKQ